MAKSTLSSVSTWGLVLLLVCCDDKQVDKFYKYLESKNDLPDTISTGLDKLLDKYEIRSGKLQVKSFGLMNAKNKPGIFKGEPKSCLNNGKWDTSQLNDKQYPNIETCIKKNPGLLSDILDVIYKNIGQNALNTIRPNWTPNLTWLPSGVTHPKWPPSNSGTASGPKKLVGSENSIDLPNRNIIFFGSPGTGKSYQVNLLISQSKVTFGKSTWKGFALKVNKVKPDGSEDPEYNPEDVKFFQRVTFHPEYSYYDFVGSYKPAVGRKYAEETIVFKQKQGETFPIDPVEFEKNDNPLKLLKPDIKEDKFKKAFNNWGASPVVYYDFEPGPFSLAFVEALKNQNPKKKVVMLIEEINRGNCAAIFGDVFQLLDRDKDGEGEYSISIGSEWGSWLKDALKDIPKETMERYFSCSNTQYKIRLPSNLYLLATMNTADQGLFPMDSAFKRRWFMKYIGMNHAEDSKLHFKVPVQIGKEKEWEKFRDKINEKILEYTKNPDKRLGPFFVKESEFDTDEVSEEIRAELFFSKVIYYLWSVLKPAQREKVFVKVESTTSLDDLEKRYFNKEEVFQKTVFE